jgi:hypothetical protein
MVPFYERRRLELEDLPETASHVCFRCTKRGLGKTPGKEMVNR